VSEESSGLKKQLQMGLGTLMSRVLGLFRDILMLLLFPVGVTDAWVTAFKLPHLWRRLWSEGGVSIALGSSKETNRDGLRTWVSVFVFGLVVLGFTFAPQWISFLRPADSTSLESFDFQRAVLFFRIMVFFLLTNALYALLSAEIHGLGDFKSPAWGMVIFNVLLIAFLFMPTTWSSIEGIGMALGVLFGGLAQLGYVYWQFKKKNLKIKFNFSVSKKVLQSFKKLGFSFVGLNGFGIMNLFNIYHLGTLGPGLITAFYLIERMLEFPLSLISNSSSTVSAAGGFLVHGNKSKTELWKVYRKEIYRSTLWILPFVLGSLWGSGFIIPILFQHGAIEDSKILDLIHILKWSSGVLLLAHLHRMVGTFAFAIQEESKFSLWVLLGSFSHFFLCFILVPRWGIEGLLLSQTLTLGGIQGLFLLKILRN